MLKTRINQKVCLKVLLLVGLECEAINASAQNEGQNDDYSSLMSYFELKKAECPVQQYKAGRVISLTIDTLGRSFLNGKQVELNQLKSTVKNDISTSWEKSRQKEIQLVVYRFARNVNVDIKIDALRSVKDAYEEIRNDIASNTGNRDESYLDYMFPMVICEDTNK